MPLLRGAPGEAMTSPSQITTVVKGCPRQWGFKYLDNILEPEIEGSGKDRAIKFGLALHKVLEDWMLIGKDFDLNDEIALRAHAGLQLLPLKGTAQPEREMSLNFSGVVIPKMIVDLWVPDATNLPCVDSDDQGVLPAHTPAIVDYKTTKHPRRKFNGKLPGLSERADFLSDPQALCYATAALVEYPKATHVFLRWIYFASEGAPKADARDCLVSKRDVAAGLARYVLPWGRELVQLRKSPRPAGISLPPNAAACHKFKSRSPDPEKRRLAPGCGYQSLCKDVSDRDRTLAQLKEDDEMANTDLDLLAELKAERAKGRQGNDTAKINGPVKTQAKAERADPPIEITEDPAERARRVAMILAEDDDNPDARPRTRSVQPTITAAVAKAAGAPKTRAIETPETTQLRDMFAMTALSREDVGRSGSSDDMAADAYAIADAMLKFRQRYGK